MYLKSLKLQNFRSFDSAEIELQKDLTVLVGENNGGKSNAIDAIRLVTQAPGGRREIYCESTDVRTPSPNTGFALEATFGDLDAGQQGRLISAATDATLSEARFGLQFEGGPTDRPRMWGGKPGHSLEPGCHDMIRHAYMPPLRDARRALASGNPTRIMALLRHFLGEQSAEDLARELSRRPGHAVLSKVDQAIDKSLSALTFGVRPQAASLGFASHEALIDIARDLRFKMADYGLAPEDLRYSGHGYANLLFMATIAVELESIRNSDLTLFLVEEPEAHLHPQLQAAVLAFLRDQATQSRNNMPDGGPSGHVQVIVATHSPNLSAWVSSKQLVVFKSIVPKQTCAEGEMPSRAAPGETAESNDLLVAPASSSPKDAPIRRVTRCIPLARIPMADQDRRKIDRYLDVTKAALLFGGRVLLVEGIAEALLLPVIAERHTFRTDRDSLRLFRGTVFVAIDGVDFEPYVSLLATSVNEARIAQRVVILTDGDHGLAKVGPDAYAEPERRATNNGRAGDDLLAPGERRKQAITELAAGLGSAGVVEVIASRYSLESELLEAGNESILRASFLRLHPRSEERWDAVVALRGDERASAIRTLFARVKKGDFAQILASLIEEGVHGFTVPGYIERGIREVVA